MKLTSDQQDSNFQGHSGPVRYYCEFAVFTAKQADALLKLINKKLTK